MFDTEKFSSKVENSNDDSDSSVENSPEEIRRMKKKLDRDFEKRCKAKETEFEEKLKAMAKEMNVLIDAEKEKYKKKFENFIENHRRNDENDRRVRQAEERTIVAERFSSEVQEKLKEEQLKHYRQVQQLQHEIDELRQEKPTLKNQSSQTPLENPDEKPSLLEFEQIEIDYLKKIFLAYATGKDRLTMIKVICALLRYDDEQKSFIVEQEKLRQK